MTRRISLAIILALLVAATAAAGQLVLKNGQTFQGQVTEADETISILTAEGLKTFPRSEVERFDNDPLTGISAEVRAAFLTVKRKALRQETVAEGLALWEGYLKANPAGPLEGAAKDEMAALRKAEAEGLVPWGGKLLTPAARDIDRREAHELIDAGVGLYKAGKFSEAVSKLAAANLLWPEHLTVTFYSAMAMREVRRPVDAAKRFIEVTEALPEHVPALNNAACLCAQQTDYGTAVRMMARALRVAAADETLADNSLQIVHKLAVDKQSPMIRLDMFKVPRDDLRLLEAAVAAQQARRSDGKVRWGDRWVTRAELEQYVAAQQTADAQIKALAMESQSLKSQISQAGKQLEDLFGQTDPSFKFVDRKGNTVVESKSRRQQLQELLTKLSQRAAEVAQDLARVRKSRPEATFTGYLAMLDVESPTAGIKGGEAIGDEPVRLAIQGGKAVLMTESGSALGRINADRHDPKSIWNPLGRHGSPFSKYSIFDADGPNGDAASPTSPWNPAATQPPRIVLDGKLVCYLSANAALSPRVSVESLAQALKSAQ